MIWRPRHFGKQRQDNSNEEEYYDQEEFDYDDIPFGCRACGGDYPNCTTSCPLFDD